ncbi:hypothetical protein IFM46972_04106 [Aspergillus udagawae]|uniref:Uncharacterized protein n=1 Tax=Aspergillus udagawae TaxID=91492 RepID=A0A8H3RQH6_9EURO|nr:hypothetical protein IFM46972_04106 [Aspergillus udagawae]
MASFREVGRINGRLHVAAMPISNIAGSHDLAHRFYHEQDVDNIVQWLFSGHDEEEADHGEQNNVIYMRTCPSCIRSAYYACYPHCTLLMSIDRTGSWSKRPVPRLHDCGCWGNGPLYVLILFAHFPLAYIPLRTSLTPRNSHLAITLAPYSRTRYHRFQ